MEERRIFTKEFKERVAELARAADRKQPETATGLGISGNMLARWKREAKQGGAGQSLRRQGESPG
ncbi:MAG: transposase [Spirochaetaceae bacterium]|nr:transposase [Spirochaetaceae bacterium]